MEIAKYTKDALVSVQVGNFMSKNDMLDLATMSEELQENWEKRQIWRTENEMRVSVLNDVKHPDRASKYWQCVREMGVFFEQLVLLSFQYRENEIEIKRISRKIENETDDLEKEFLQISMDRCHYNRRNMELEAKDRLRELKLWSKIKAELNDKSFDDKDPNTNQLESMARRFDIEMQIAMQTGSAAPETRNLVGLKTTVDRVSETLKLT